MRKKIPSKIVSLIMYKSMGKCCVCGESSIQIHHLDENRNNNDLDNLCPLCPNHHDLAHKKGRISREWNVSKLKFVRDKFYDKVESKRYKIIDQETKKKYRLEGMFIGNSSYGSRFLICLDKEENLNIESELIIPKKLHKKRYLYDTSRFFFGIWDEIFIMRSIAEHYTPIKSKKYKQIDNQMLLGLAKVIKEFFYEPNVGCLATTKFINQKEYQKIFDSFNENLFNSILKNSGINQSSVKIKLEDFKMFETLYSESHMLIFLAYRGNQIISMVPLRLDIRKKLESKRKFLMK